MLRLRHALRFFNELLLVELDTTNFLKPELRIHLWQKTVWETLALDSIRIQDGRTLGYSFCDNSRNSDACRTRLVVGNRDHLDLVAADAVDHALVPRLATLETEENLETLVATLLAELEHAEAAVLDASFHVLGFVHAESGSAFVGVQSIHELLHRHATVRLRLA